jgi:hypothetical protein
VPGILANPLAAAKGKLKDCVGVDEVADVEIGICVPVVLANRVENEGGASKSSIGLQP